MREWCSRGGRAQQEREPGEDDGGEEGADGASPELLHQEEQRDDAAREPDDQRCAHIRGGVSQPYAQIKCMRR